MRLWCKKMRSMKKAAIGALLIYAFAISAQQAVKPPEDRIEAAFGWMKGDWLCSGTFPRSGKPIETDVRIQSVLQGARLLLQQDDRPPNQFHALTFWGWSSDQHRFSSRLLDSAGGDRLFTSTGWDQDAATWSQEPPDAASPQRFVFTRKAGAFGYRFDVQRDGQWVTVDTLQCSRK